MVALRSRGNSGHVFTICLHWLQVVGAPPISGGASGRGGGRDVDGDPGAVDVGENDGAEGEGLGLRRRCCLAAEAANFLIV